MSSKAAGTVARAFPVEAEIGFRFLTEELGLSEPSYDDRVLPCVSFVGQSLGYDVMLEEMEGKIIVSAWLAKDTRRVRADLGDLVQAAGVAPRQRVRTSAQTLSALRTSIEDQARWLRTVHPILAGPGGWDLVRKAHP